MPSISTLRGITNFRNNIIFTEYAYIMYKLLAFPDKFWEWAFEYCESDIITYNFMRRYFDDVLVCTEPVEIEDAMSSMASELIDITFIDDATLDYILKNSDTVSMDLVFAGKSKLITRSIDGINECDINYDFDRADYIFERFDEADIEESLNDESESFSDRWYKKYDEILGHNKLENKSPKNL